ncbi:MAG: type II toxin-antitoxin system VapC family toxin [Spirochaetes bacterium]|nr:MAG: type II toxin-antitoxin system VapC family toxin [Spirochaetota bacterium]
MHNSEEGILMDTHIWIWLMEGNSVLTGSKALTSIERAAESGLLSVSVISVWEIGMLESTSRLIFNVPCMEWIDKALRLPGLHLVPLSPEIAIESTRLPDNFHGDPADRIITATARINNVSLITKDKKILEYGESGFLKVIKL